MKKFIAFFAIILGFISCTKFDNNYRNYDGCHFGTCFSKEGLTIVSSVSKPNSVGGVTIFLTVSNETSRTIKYISLNGDVQNTFGDAVYCEVWGRTGMPINITGPIYNGQTITYQTNDCFYNNNAKTYCINAVSITYLE